VREIGGSRYHPLRREWRGRSRWQAPFGPVGKVLDGCYLPPYQTGQGMDHAKESIMGDPNEIYNVLKWEEARLNILGTPEYDPSISWMAKVREDG
jgi:hypothetical protein